MRVCYLLQRARRTGARSVGKRLGRALAERTDHEVVFMVPAPLDIDTDRAFIVDGGDVHVPTVNVFAAISALDPDVVVAHTVTEELIDALPVIRSVVPTVFRYGVNLAESHVNGTDSDLTRIPEVVRQFDAVLAPSAHAARKVRSLGVDGRRVHVVHPAVDRSDRETHDPDAAPNAVGVVARHGRIKHLPLVARALRVYEDTDAYGDAPRVLVGGEVPSTDADGDDAEAPAVLRHAAALSVAHKIDVLGWVDPAEAIYPEVRAVVLPSFSENHPAVYGEALAAGVPVLAPDAGWAIGPTVFTPDDPAALASELHEVLDAPAEYHALQRERAPDGIGLDAAVADLAGALERVVDRAGPFTVSGGVPS